MKSRGGYTASILGFSSQSECMKNTIPPPESLKCLTPPLPWESDEFLQPILPNDGLLQYGELQGNTICTLNYKYSY